MQLTDEQRHEIAQLVESEYRLLGSWSKVAAKCGVNPAVVHTYVRRPEEWSKVGVSMWGKIAAALGYSFGKRWKIAETMNTRLLMATLQMAQEHRMCLAISDKAGSGKTASIQAYKTADDYKSVFVMECEEWSKRSFLTRLSRELGIAYDRGYVSVEVMAEKVIERLKGYAKDRSPLLILDEADKLKPSALRFIIPLYNKLEDEVGIVLCGTENLRREIQRGAARAVKGYDEIDSRLGRTYVTLTGVTADDVRNICMANGLTDAEGIERVWDESGKSRKAVQGRYVEVAEDLRKIKRLIQRELLSLKLKAVA
jgi:hypothetical protein